MNVELIRFAAFVLGSLFVVILLSSYIYERGVKKAMSMNESIIDIYNRKIDELKELPTDSKDYSPEYIAGWNDCVETFKLRKEK